MSQTLNSLLESSSQALILLPLNPHFDEVAAGLALYLSLAGKKDAVIACPTPMLVEFNRLVGVNKITSELGNKNLTIKLTDYPADNVERVSYDIERGEFKLTIVPKANLSAPKKDQVNISYAGVSADTVILIGGVHDDHFPALASKEIGNAKVIHIGTKQGDFSKEAITLSKPLSSVSEVITGLIRESELSMDADIATNLLMGIEEGSEGFARGEVNADTFALASELMRAGGRRISKEQLPDRRNFPPGAIPGSNFGMPMPQTGGRTPKNWYEPKVFKGGGVPTS